MRCKLFLETFELARQLIDVDLLAHPEIYDPTKVDEALYGNQSFSSKV